MDGAFPVQLLPFVERIFDVGDVFPVLFSAFCPPVVPGVAVPFWSWEFKEVQAWVVSTGCNWVAFVGSKDFSYEFPSRFDVEFACFFDFLWFPEVFRRFEFRVLILGDV